MVEVTQTEQERLAEAHDLAVAESIDAPLFVECFFGNTSLRAAINEFKSRCAAKLEAAIIEHRRLLAAQLLDGGLYRECVTDYPTSNTRALDDFIHRVAWRGIVDDYVVLKPFAPWCPENVLKLLDAIYEEVANGIH